MESCLMERSSTLLRIIFLLHEFSFTPDQDCGRCKYVLGTAYLCTQILCVTTSLMEHRGSCDCCRKCPNWSACMLLFFIFFTVIAIIFSIICIIPQQKAFWITIHCRLQTNRIIRHGRTLFVASSSGTDSILNHEGAFSHNKAGIGLPVIWVRTTDVWKPSGTHGRMKLIAQVINGLGNHRPLVLPQCSHTWSASPSSLRTCNNAY